MLPSSFPRPTLPLGRIPSWRRDWPFVEQHDLGWVLTAPIDVLLAEGEYVEPDLVFVQRERLGIISYRGIEGPPDLVVEIASMIRWTAWISSSFTVCPIPG